MKRFTFRLEGLLRLKRQQLRQAELRLGAAHQALREVEQRRDSLRQQLEDESGRKSESQPAPSLNDMMSLRQWLDELQRRIDHLAAEAERGREAVAQAAATRQQAATEVDQLASAREREWLEYKKQIEQARQHELNDWIMHRRGANTRDSVRESAELDTEPSTRRASAAVNPDDEASPTSPLSRGTRP